MKEFEGCIGIDLGTTFSCVGVWENDNVKILDNNLGSKITPSWVYFGDEIVVGQYAKNMHSKFPQDVIYDVKRFMGKRFNEINEDVENVTYNVEEDTHGFPVIVIKDQKFKPEQISGMILTEMKHCAEKYLNMKVTKAVITVPAYFNDAQRNATKNAALLAGLDCLRIINEPTSACLCYGIDKKEECVVLVYDFGGGTLDVSLLNINDGVFEVLGTSGNTHLGGIDFDERLCSYMISDMTLKCSEKIGSFSQEKLYGMVRSKCEQLKKDLSSAKKAYFEFDALDYERTISREEFVLLCKDIFKKCLEPVNQVINDCEITLSEIDDIVLVGGSSRIPYIQEMLLEYFNNSVKINNSVNPDEAVAYGASVQGAILTKSDQSEKTRDIVLLDVIPLSLGVETSGGMMAKIIEKNSTVPTEKSQVFSTTEDDQSVVTIKIFEGERPFTEHNHLLGSFELTGLELVPRGVPKIEVIFSIDENGILSVTAVDKKTGMSNNVVISNDTGRLSQEEINIMIREAEKNISSDEARKQIEEEYKNFIKYIHAMRGSLVSEEATTILSKEDINKALFYLVEVYQYLEENKKDLLIEKLKEYREETEKNIGPLVYQIYARSKKNEKMSEEEVLEKLNNLMEN
jgi:molecular chaperone DnaK (HSP70)